MRHDKSFSHDFWLVFASLFLLFVFSPFSLAQKGGASPSQGSGGSSAAGGAGGGGTPYFETQMEAYGAVNQLSATIAQNVCSNSTIKALPKKATVVIFDATSFQNVQAWQAFSASATAIEHAYETLLSDTDKQSPELKALFQASAGGVLQPRSDIPITSGTDLSTLITTLASSTTESASSFTIQDSTMAVSIAHQILRSNGCNVELKYYPLFGSYTNLKTDSDFVKTAFLNLNTLRAYIQVKLDYIHASPTSSQSALLSDLNSQYDSLLKSLSTAPSQGQGQTSGGGGSQGASPSTSAQPTSSSSATQTTAAGISSLMQGAALDDLLAQPTTYILYADIVAAGGTQRDRKNVFTLVTGDWISYSGGAIVNYALIHAPDTALMAADTLRYRTGLAAHLADPREAKNIENTNAGENEDSICGQEKRLHWWQWEKHTAPSCK